MKMHIGFPFNPDSVICNTCKRVYPFKFPWLRFGASLLPMVTIPVAYVLTYKAAAWIGTALGGVAPWSVLTTGILLPTALYFAVFMRNDPRVTMQGRTLGPIGAAFAGTVCAAASPALVAAELQDRAMRPFTLSTDPVPAFDL